MEINKITIIIIVAVLLSFPILLSCDNTQYKQIGDTYYYLMEDWQGNAHLYYKEGSEHFFYAIAHEGVISDVYWNQKFIIIKCCQSDNDTIKFWYVMKNIKEYDWNDYEIKPYFNRKEYEIAIDSIGLSEEHMEHTDGTIPWRINL